MSCAEVSPVRIFLALAEALGSRANAADFGRSLRDSFACFDPTTSSWKTSQCCWLEGLQRYSDNWPRSGMTHNGTAYPLPTLAPLTDVTEYGLLPTPTATPYGSTNNGQRADGSTYRTAGMPSLETMARRSLWPTPTADDAKSSGSRNTPGSKAHPGISLTDAVRGDGGTGRKELWPTPHGMCAPNKHPAGPSGIELGRAVNRTQCPTPSANDWKGSSRPGQRRRQLTDPAVGVIQAGGSLNPTWVEWLMGFPLGWTDLGASAMPLSRKSRKSSDTP